MGMFFWQLVLLIATIVRCAVVENNPLINNLLLFPTGLTLQCPICLEEFLPNDPIFASHPFVGIDKTDDEEKVKTIYNKMHLSHIQCAIKSIRYIGKNCSLCKERITNSEAFGTKFLASIFELSFITMSNFDMNGKDITMPTLSIIFQWILMAIDNGNQVQQVILRNLLANKSFPSDAFRSSSFIISLLSPQLQQQVTAQFRHVLYIFRKDIFKLIEITEQSFKWLKDQKLLRYHLISDMHSCGDYRDNDEFSLSYLIMQHYMSGTNLMLGVMEEFHLTHIKQQPLFIEYLIFSFELNLAKQYLHEMIVPSTPLLERTMKYIYQTNQSIKLMNKYAHYIQLSFNDNEFLEIFQNLKYNNILDKSFIMFKYAGSAQRQLLLIPYLRPFFVNQPELMRFYASAAEDLQVIQGLSALAIENNLTECIYILISHAKVDSVVLFGMLTALLIQDEFDNARLMRLNAFSSVFPNSHHLIYPLQVANNRLNRQVFDLLANNFDSSHFVWVTIDPLKCVHPDSIRLAYSRAKSISTQMLIFHTIQYNITQLIDYYEIGITLPPSYSRLLLVQCEIANLDQQSLYLRATLNLPKLGRFPAELQSDLFICNGLNRITWLTVRLNSVLLTNNNRIQALFTQLTDPFYLVAIISIAIQRNYFHLFESLLPYVDDENIDLLVIPFQQLMLTDYYSFSTSMLQRISFVNNPSLLISFIDALPGLSDQLFSSIMIKFMTVIDEQYWNLLLQLILEHFKSYQMQFIDRIGGFLQLFPKSYIEILAIYAESECILGLRQYLSYIMLQ